MQLQSVGEMSNIGRGMHTTRHVALLEVDKYSLLFSKCMPMLPCLHNFTMLVYMCISAHVYTSQLHTHAEHQGTSVVHLLCSKALQTPALALVPVCELPLQTSASIL